MLFLFPSFDTSIFNEMKYPETLTNNYNVDDLLPVRTGNIYEFDEKNQV